MLFSFWIDSSAFTQFPLAVTDVQCITLHAQISNHKAEH